jgi:hypothetical protein
MQDKIWRYFIKNSCNIFKLFLKVLIFNRFCARQNRIIQVRLIRTSKLLLQFLWNFDRIILRVLLKNTFFRILVFLCCFKVQANQSRLDFSWDILYSCAWIIYFNNNLLCFKNMSSKNPKLCIEMYGWIGWKQKMLVINSKIHLKCFKIKKTD